MKSVDDIIRMVKLRYTIVKHGGVNLQNCSGVCAWLRRTSESAEVGL